MSAVVTVVATTNAAASQKARAAEWSRRNVVPSRALLANGSLSRLSHVVNRLEKREWVRRAPDPEDGRYTLATLTEEGWTKVVDTAPGHVAAVRGLVFDPLTRGQARQLRDIGERVLRAIDPDGDCLS